MKQYLVPFAWALSSVAALVAVITWLDSLLVPFSNLTTYDIFPLFGLLAFSLMWSHYVVGAFKTYYGVDQAKLAAFFRITAYVVLGAILLHPGMLTWQFMRDGGGLPVNYVAPHLRVYVVIAELAWLMFLAYEFHRKFGTRTWWHYIERLSDVGMVLILIHAYKVGYALQVGWFKYVWYFYAATFAAAVIYATWYRRKTTKRWL